MERVAFTMQLKAGFVDEYRRRHAEIWPELRALLQKAGISDYSIFVDPNSLKLFAVQKIKDGEPSFVLADQPIMRKWWDYMADIMEVNSDNSPVCTTLVEVFHLD